MSTDMKKSDNSSVDANQFISSAKVAQSMFSLKRFNRLLNSSNLNCDRVRCSVI